MTQEGETIPRSGAGEGEKRRARSKTARGAPGERPLRTTEGNFDQLVQSVRRAQVPVNQPVALISQAPRSGGTLLRNLFDGHPQCHVHP